LYEIITKGKIPYVGMSNDEVVQKVEGGYKMSCPPECPSSVYILMLKCWETDPNRRPTFLELKTELDKISQNLDYGRPVSIKNDDYGNARRT